MSECRGLAWILVQADAVIRGKSLWISCPFGCQRSRYRDDTPSWRAFALSGGSVRTCITWILLLQVICVAAAKNEKVCSSKDIRNMVSKFKDLENCTVIEGSLQILLIDYANPSEYNQWSFPDLVEVTEYMLLYRVYGLKTLSQIFPNLSVIRGQKLFFNYALVAFEMPDMEELGLHGLTKIMRGAVRIEKNPHLCYIDTLDWSQITTVKPEDNFIIENKDIDECVNVCPRRQVSPDHEEGICNQMEVELANGDKRQQQLCWTGQHCQKVCPRECGVESCFMQADGRDRSALKCCHRECLGGCMGSRDTECIACVNIFYDGRCVKRCPPGTYEYRKRRCITEAECRNINVHGRPWKLFKETGTRNGQCVPECPSGYIESRQDVNICQKCEGPCPKVCNGLMVDSVSAAQQIKGCTVINGVLEIQIRGGKHVGKELEVSLGEIEEVQDYVSITDAHALTNLRFLKNLRLIRGESLFEARHALVVINNQNLRDIWDFNTHPNLTIKRGNVFFHYNRKLCLHLIEQLIQVSGINGTDKNDVSRETNGDLIPCHTQELTLEVVSHLPTHAIIRWTNFFLNDHRELLGWVINLREAPFRNVTMYDSRDACGADEWKQEDVPPDPDEKARWIAHILYQLKPFTQYAVYVQTFTVAQAKKGAMSPIVYFTTDPDVPWPARDIEVSAVSQGELHVLWKPPLKPNGNVTHYYVYWQPQILSRKKLDQRNYCEDKLRLPGNKKETVIDNGDENNATAPSGKCCQCDKSEEQQMQEEDERLMQITFEDYLHDTVYIKRPLPHKNETFAAAQDDRTAGTVPSNEASKDPGPQGFPNPSEDIEQRRRRRRRSIPGNNGLPNFSADSAYDMLYTFNMTNMTEAEIEEEEEPVPYEVAIVHGKNEVLLPNLRHFQEYSIEVIACHDYVEGQKFKRCSNRAITTQRTLAAESADTLNPMNITTINGSRPGEVIIRWSDPESPNGLIVTYEIELRRTETQDYLPQSRCITHKKYWEIGGYLVDKVSPPGNWSFRIRATSLAGNGSWTPTMYFYVAELESASGLNIQMIAGVAAFTALLVILVVAASIWLVAKKRFNPPVPDGVLYASVNPEYWSAADVYVPDEWEVGRDKIQLLRELGQGSFGMVYEGIAKEVVANEPITKVAIKTVNEKATMRDRIEFLNEASVMKVFNCNHVVKLRGVVSKGQPTLVIMELMARGDLKSFLRSLRPEEGDRKPPTLREILQTAGEIADGMAYLAAKKFVHRDLAARNCMVSEDMVVKIGDFGMTREIYETDYYRKGGKGLLPVRWMAPESLQDGLFTSQSDVWSYGVVLWEMATLAAQPYQGLANEQVLHFVIDKGIMEKPEGCPEQLYDIMQLCWNHSPKSRPTFCEIIELLVPDLNTNFHEVSYFYSSDNRGRGVPADAAAEEFCGDDDDADDSNTPLTGSPYHAYIDSNTHQGHTEGEGDEEDEILHDTLSRHSSLSYDSRVCPSSCSTPDRKRALMVVVDENVPSQRWDTTADHSGTTSAKKTGGAGEGEDTWRPNHTAWEDRNSQVPPSSQNNSNEGSKGSSKSTESSHSGGVNGFVNGQVPRYVTPPQHAQC